MLALNAPFTMPNVALKEPKSTPQTSNGVILDSVDPVYSDTCQGQSNVEICKPNELLNIINAGGKT